MNKFKNVMKLIAKNKVTIIRRTVIVSAAVVGVTLATGLIKIQPTEKTVEIVEAAVDVVKKAAE